ncbi:dTDP-4-dehydrorhamnose 3,5-epimerase [bacterium]|nr:dTDP-4-dehydrorhamnose 3,5-epimerase [bacterium]
MKITPTPIEGLKVIELPVHQDSRGYFLEFFHTEKFRNLDLPTNFFQDNLSHSQPNVLRGLHYQKNPLQGKLVGVTRGRIWDVTVDLRKNSPTFGQHFSLELSESQANLIWIPGGFAHGFCVLGNEAADVFYKVNCPYNSTKEGGILWSDSGLNIKWPIEFPIVSEKDKALITLHEFINTEKYLHEEN